MCVLSSTFCLGLVNCSAIGALIRINTVFNFASYLFSRYSQCRYFRENLSPPKFNISIKANETSQWTAKINPRELAFHRQNAKIYSRENKKACSITSPMIAQCLPCSHPGANKKDNSCCLTLWFICRLNIWANGWLPLSRGYSLCNVLFKKCEVQRIIPMMYPHLQSCSGSLTMSSVHNRAYYTISLAQKSVLVYLF